jgi:ketosteroid isomerase-like protein
MKGEILNRKNITLLISILTLAASAVSQSTSVASINDEIRISLEVTKVLGSQVKAWNDHDLDGFMKGYWKSPELTFFSGATERHGWQETMDRYKATYQSPGHDMGKLEFANLRVEALGPKAAFVRGEWHLTMPDGKTPHGLFTLIFRKFPDGWKIVHDHTSAAE